MRKRVCVSVCLRVYSCVHGGGGGGADRPVDDGGAGEGAGVGAFFPCFYVYVGVCMSGLDDRDGCKSVSKWWRSWWRRERVREGRVRVCGYDCVRGARAEGGLQIDQQKMDEVSTARVCCLWVVAWAFVRLCARAYVRMGCGPRGCVPNVRWRGVAQSGAPLLLLLSSRTPPLPTHSPTPNPPRSLPAPHHSTHQTYPPF